MTLVAQWVRDLTEEQIGSAPFEVGDRVRHPDGRMVEITGGQYWGKHGLSNFWNWREVLEDDTLSDRNENGYGWQPK